MDAAAVRRVQLSTYDEFARLCDENGLTFFLAYGTLLGSVRHQGYIPWDDDIDVMMPRADFETFLHAFASTTHDIGSISRTPNWPLPFAKLFDRRTCVTEEVDFDIPAGVGIDLWPIDILPRQRTLSLLLTLSTRALHLASVAKSVTVRPGQTKVKRVCLVLAKRLLSPVPSARIARTWDALASSSARGGERVGVLVGSYPWSVPRGSIDGRAVGQFEGRTSPIPIGWESVLGQKYGDFMKLPEERNRVTHHRANSYWCTNEA